MILITCMHSLLECETLFIKIHTINLSYFQSVLLVASFLYLALFLLFHIYFTLCIPICLHSAWSCVGFAGTLTEVSKSKIYVHKMCFHILKTVLTNRLWQMGEKKRAFIFYSLPFLPARNDSKKCQLMVVHTVSTNTWRHVLPESNRRAQTVTWGEKAEVGR